MLVLRPKFYNRVLHVISITTVLVFLASYNSVSLSQFYQVFQGMSPGTHSINIGREMIEKLQEAKKNLHWKFWDKRASVAKFCSSDPPEILK